MLLVNNNCQSCCLWAGAACRASPCGICPQCVYGSSNHSFAQPDTRSIGSSGRWSSHFICHCYIGSSSRSNAWLIILGTISVCGSGSPYAGCARPRVVSAGCEKRIGFSFRYSSENFVQRGIVSRSVTSFGELIDREYSDRRGDTKAEHHIEQADAALLAGISRCGCVFHRFAPFLRFGSCVFLACPVGCPRLGHYRM